MLTPGEVWFPGVGWVPFEPTPTFTIPGTSQYAGPQGHAQPGPQVATGARSSSLGRRPRRLASGVASPNSVGFGQHEAEELVGGTWAV